MLMQNSQTTNTPTSDNESKETIIRFIFKDSTSLNYSFSQLEDISPSFFSQHFFNKTKLNNTIEIAMPHGFTSKSVADFVYLLKNGINEYVKESSDDSDRMPLLLKVSEYFDQKQFSISLIQHLLLPNVNGRNSFDFLLIAYEKLSHAQSAHGATDDEQYWFELFFKSLETLGLNVNSLIEYIPQLMSLDNKIAEELINKCFASVFTGNYMLIDDGVDKDSISNDNYFDHPNTNVNGTKAIENKTISIVDLEKMIDLLYNIRNCGNNIYDLLTDEYMILCSNQSLNEINDRKTPTFTLKIPCTVDHFYEEYPMNMKLNGKHIVVIVCYKKNEDSLSVNLKLCDNTYSRARIGGKEDKYSFNIVTFLSSVIIDDDDSYCQMNVRSVSNNKSSINIFRQNNMTKFFNETAVNKRAKDNNNNTNKDDSCFLLKINLKVCYTHSILSSFLLKAFPKYYDNPEITKLPKDFLVFFLKSKYLVKHYEDEVVTALINWLNNEANIKEDISELIDEIKWDKVNERLIFEFIIKYCSLITHEETEEKIIEGLQSHYVSKSIKVNDVLDQIYGDLFDAARAINYAALFSSVKKQAKSNQITQSTQLTIHSIPTTLSSSITGNHCDNNIQKNGSLFTQYNNYIGNTNGNDNHTNNPITLTKTNNYFHLSSNTGSCFDIKEQSRQKEIDISNQSLSLINRKSKAAISLKIGQKGSSKLNTKIVKKEELLGKLIHSYQTNTINSNMIKGRKNNKKEIVHIKSSLNIIPHYKTKSSANSNSNTKSLSNLHKGNNNDPLLRTKNRINAKSMSQLVLETQQSDLKQTENNISSSKTIKKTRNNKNNSNCFSPQLSGPSFDSNTISYCKNTASTSTINQKNVYHLFNLSKVSDIRGKR